MAGAGRLLRVERVRPPDERAGAAPHGHPYPHARPGAHLAENTTWSNAEASTAHAEAILATEDLHDPRPQPLTGSRHRTRTRSSSAVGWPHGHAHRHRRSSTSCSTSPIGRPERLVRLPEAAARARSRKDYEFPAAVHVQGGPAPRAEATIRSAPRLDQMDHHGIDKAMIGVGLRGAPATSSTPSSEHPDRFFGSFSVDPNRGMEGVRDLVKAYETLGHQGGHRLPGRAASRRYRSTTRSSSRSTPSASSSTSRSACTAGIAGPRVPIGLPAHRAHRRGVLVLPRAQVRDAPRRRAVGRSRRQAHAQVAEPLLLDLRVRPPVLPEGDRRLRQHPRRRQGHVRRLLPDGPQPRPDLRASCPTCRSRTRCGRSSSARTPCGSSSSTSDASTTGPRPSPRRRR